MVAAGAFTPSAYNELPHIQGALLQCTRQRTLHSIQSYIHRFDWPLSVVDISQRFPMKTMDPPSNTQCNTELFILAT
jgi:hypothetical protein